jgi:group I intron endonuclease
MEGCIYLLTCLHNGKRYVGQHNKPDPKRRWKAHLLDAKLEKYPSIILHKALRMYGEDGFSWEVLYTGACESLNRMECYYAEMYESYIWDFPGGYNMVECGGTTRGHKHSPETKEKIGKAHICKKYSPETKEKIRQALIGRKYSKESIENMRQGQLGRKKPQEVIEKTRQAHIGAKRSPEAIENIRQGQLGKKRSLESIQKGIQTRQLNKEKKLLIG